MPSAVGSSSRRQKRGAGSKEKCVHWKNDVIVIGLTANLNALNRNAMTYRHASMRIKKAIQSVRKFPLPLRRTDDIDKLAGVGPMTLAEIVKILRNAGETVETDAGARSIRQASRRGRAAASSQNGATDNASPPKRTRNARRNGPGRQASTAARSRSRASESAVVSFSPSRQEASHVSAFDSPRSSLLKKATGRTTRVVLLLDTREKNGRDVGYFRAQVCCYLLTHSLF